MMNTLFGIRFVPYRDGRRVLQTLIGILPILLNQSLSGTIAIITILWASVAFTPISALYGTEIAMGFTGYNQSDFSVMSG